ncbi:glycosyl transferase group 1 [Rhodopirellula maiorica SM1]|uniref:Glycosyl transferase group 1 n=1 Tax=Rhodopirellula maiorica SM1 TaxID=1265738 RepID=M5RFM3_9BACT|nr:glycosyltransferase [Rhodopirellula maiorica]EMI17881.1 glycosyl transferase group 1 [Rhodopirellula maiorica SM1]
MTREVPKTITQQFIGMLQRRAYAKAQRSADLMTYNSHYMRNLYRQNANADAEHSEVVYQAIGDSAHIAAREQQIQRSPNTILAVSGMAAWKGADQLVLALKRLRQQGIDAKLRLVGPWPDPSYKRLVLDLISESKLQEHVSITGKVPRKQLYEEMAAARVFALPSRCESFGIPAVEAQVFGTPVIGSSTTAMAEIGGLGGEYCDPWDLDALVRLLTRHLTDQRHWQLFSDAARENALKYRWDVCSRPLLRMFMLV